MGKLFRDWRTRYSVGPLDHFFPRLLLRGGAAQPIHDGPA